MNIQVIDEDGAFFHHTGEFRVFHHARGVVLQPGGVYRIAADGWIASQSVLEKTDDPFKTVSKPKTAKPAA